MEHPAEHSSTANHVESHWRTQLRNRIIQASSLLEILLSGLVLIGLLFSAVPLVKWMPGLLFYGNEVEIRSFLERSLDIVIGIEFIKMLAKHSPGSSLEVLLYAIARHLVVGQVLLCAGLWCPPAGRPSGTGSFSKAERHPGRGVYLPPEGARQGRGGRGHSFRRRDF